MLCVVVGVVLLHGLQRRDVSWETEVLYALGRVVVVHIGFSGGALWVVCLFADVVHVPSLDVGLDVRAESGHVDGEEGDLFGNYC